MICNCSVIGYTCDECRARASTSSSVHVYPEPVDTRPARPTYRFSDVAGESWLVMGTTGVSFTDHPPEAFTVLGHLDAVCFAAWLANSLGCHVLPVRVD